MSDTTTPKVIVVVRFRSRLSDEELERTYKARLPEFRAVPGLLQKYYTYDESAHEWCGVYLWESEESAQSYMESDLRKSIGAAYQVEGAPRIEKLTVVELLRP